MNIPVQGRITADFNKWVNYNIAGHPTRIYKGRKQWQHQAWDIVTDKPSPIYAPADCTVIEKIDGKPESHIEGYGNELYVKFDDGAVMRTAHMQINIPVSNGQRVPKGSLLGYTGKTGYRVPSWVIHTHLEILIDGKRVNPETYTPPQNQPANLQTEKRMIKLLQNHRLIWKKDASDKGLCEYWIVRNNEDKRKKDPKFPLETKHIVKTSKAEVAALFGGYGKLERKDWTYLAGLTTGDDFDLNNTAITHPELFEAI